MNFFKGSFKCLQGIQLNNDERIYNSNNSILKGIGLYDIPAPTKFSDIVLKDKNLKIKSLDIKEKTMSFVSYFNKIYRI